MKNIIQLSIVLLSSLVLFSCSTVEADVPVNTHTTKKVIQKEYLTTTVLIVKDSLNNVIRYDSTIKSNYNDKIFHRTLIQK